MDAKTFSIPIFPLPKVVFFPNTLLPLHIFEPRFKEMVGDCLTGDGVIGIAQLKPGWETDYYGAPPVYRILGIGEIVNSRKWDDGRYDIVLLGRHRGQIVRENTQGQYRVADVELLSDFTSAERDRQVQADYQPLLRLFQKLNEVMPETADALDEEKRPAPPPGPLADIMASALIENPYEKQCILSELDVARRLKLVTIQLETMLAQH